MPGGGGAGGSGSGAGVLTAARQPATATRASTALARHRCSPFMPSCLHAFMPGPVALKHDMHYSACTPLAGHRPKPVASSTSCRASWYKREHHP